MGKKGTEFSGKKSRFKKNAVGEDQVAGNFIHPCFQGYPDPPDDMDLSSDNPLSSFVEVCMDSDNEDSNPADTEKGLDDKENQMGGEGEGGSFPTSFSEFSRNLRLTQQRKVKSTKISYKKLIISALIRKPRILNIYFCAFFHSCCVQ